ncbi:prepilin-type N-terminal cleavage/methylation domain-containing protein [Salinibacterium sp. SWN248]|uniref:prepilin-type N-terminal cleavage/methylation domain-containing protein n=1 Tax=Salinibacterium sp. SWN248 TaxID=2792056 RepID=UPI0018CD977C|nr:prepilin-type N-terminal cleavage/methylation domain-containing protein [Salinibacterium sp. SWN248]MBH0023224.1 prepilin-type N-terminal cleavage/methylation domain-containing protein [Salinibacterium sp. SWN248]
MLKVLQRLRSSDAGMSLLEVLVAMMIFAIVSLGVLQTLTTVLAITRDNRARVVATNLAAQEVDLARDAGDVFTLFDDTYTKTLNGDVFTVSRSTAWVPSSNADATCGSGGGTLQYKRINIAVTWPNMRAGTEAVQFDTLLAPNDRINDPDLGTILVSVIGGSGEGSEGVSVTATPASPSEGAQSLATSPAPTDSDGCTFILKVAPGNYNVGVSRSGYITDDGQTSSPSQLTQVVAGTASSVSFNYDDAASFDASFIAASAPADVEISRNMDLSFLSSYGVHTESSTSSSLTRSVDLFPWRSGYVGIAGTYTPKPEDPDSTAEYCASPNPALWPEEEIAGVTYRSPDPTPVAANPGGSVDMVVPMGLVDVSSLAGTRIRATSTDPVLGSGDPGCTESVRLNFRTLNSSTQNIALPYGTWEIEQRIGSSWVPVGLGDILSPIIGPTETVAGIVTVDPRVAS